MSGNFLTHSWRKRVAQRNPYKAENVLSISSCSLFLSCKHRSIISESQPEASSVWSVSVNNPENFKVDLGILSLSSAASQSLSFYNKDERGEIQRVKFDTDQVKKIFHGSFHKVNTRVTWCIVQKRCSEQRERLSRRVSSYLGWTEQSWTSNVSLMVEF